LVTAAGLSAETWTVDDSKHTQIWQDRPAEYEKRVGRFLAGPLGGSVVAPAGGPGLGTRAANDARAGEHPGVGGGEAGGPRGGEAGGGRGREGGGPRGGRGCQGQGPAARQAVQEEGRHVTAEVRLGTQGWSYDDWNGTFYPPGAKQEDRLPFYALVFDTVELDSTFYGPPKPTIARSWARHTPAGFRFAAKLPREITHDALLRDSAPALTAFARAMEPLGDKLGPLLVQMPAEFTRSGDAVRALEAFLAARPAPIRLAVEFRHATWHVPATWESLRRHGVAVAWTEWRELARRRGGTARLFFPRRVGARGESSTRAPVASV